MSENNINVRTAMQWCFGISAIAAWAAFLILLFSKWSERTALAAALILLAALGLTACAVLQQRMLFAPLDKLSCLVENWGGTEPEEIEPQIADLSGPVGGLGQAFYGQMDQVERRLAELEDTVRERTKREVQDQITDNICQSLLPRTLKEYPSRRWFEAAGLVRRGQRKRCTFYDFFYVDPGLLCLAVGEVMAGSINAAMLMALTQTLIRSRIRSGRSVAETLNDVNAQIYDYGIGGEVCALMGTLDISTGTVSFVNAGGCQPLLMRNGDRYEKTASAVSTPLGRNQNVSYRSDTFRLRQGDRLFLYTQGLDSAADRTGRTFGEQALRESLNRNRGPKEPERILKALAEEASSFLPADEAHDGYAALLLEYRKGEKDLAHCRVPGMTAYAGKVLDFLKVQLDENGIQRRHYARIAVVVDELFALCCRQLEENESITVECGVAPDAQSVTIWMRGPFRGKDPVAEAQSGPFAQSAAFIEGQGDYVNFQTGKETDTVSVVCFL